MRDSFHVFEANGLDEAAALLEAYEPTQDIEADINPEDTDIPASVFALKAAVLRMRIDEARTPGATGAGLTKSGWRRPKPTPMP